MSDNVKDAFIAGYIEACQMNAYDGFDQHCNDEMEAAWEDYKSEELNNKTGV